MDHHPDSDTVNNRAPLIVVIVLLLLPVLYVGSYLMMVVPGGVATRRQRALPGGRFHITIDVARFRFGDEYVDRFFCPL